MTLRAVLRQAVTQFKRAGLAFGHGTNNARDEAVYLILHTLKLPLGELDSVLERRLSPGELAAVEDVHRSLRARAVTGAARRGRSFRTGRRCSSPTSSSCSPR